ncbi:MAG: helix-turn-helix domain-containing protein [Muribaculaceae bacterium]
MNNNAIESQTPFSIYRSSLSEYLGNPRRFEGGAIIFCNSGIATVDVNLNSYTLNSETIFFVFPHDILEIKEQSCDFETIFFTMSQELMEESSSRIQHIVFEKLHNNPFLESVEPRFIKFVRNTLENIQYFHDEIDITFQHEKVMYQIRSLLLTIADNIKSDAATPAVFSRLEEHFRIFMKSVSQNFKLSREVAYYADKMNITPKYLNFIVQSVARRTCKGLIDSYVIMQLKSELRNSEKSIQEIAYEYNFPNQSFLGSYFKKFVGISPRAFRNGE